MPIFSHNSAARHAGTIALGALCALAISASSASAATTLHIYAKTTHSTFTDPSGHHIRGHVPPPPAGSVLTNTGVEYRGSFKHHAKELSATTNIICFVKRAPKALCYGQIAIGGSMLLANRFTANLARANPFASIPITAGTNRFAGARGTIHTTMVGNGVNFRITYTT